MRRLALVLAVAGLLCLSQAGQAAELQSDWFVRLGLVSISGYTPSVGPWDTDWDFTGPLGAFGPFVVTQPDPLWSERLVSVQDTHSVPAGTAIDLWGQLRYAVPDNAVVTGISVGLETNYDATQMLLLVLVHHQNGTDEPLWSQQTSGHVMGRKDIATTKYSVAAGDSLLLRVTTVPEPAGLLALGMPLVAVALCYRRRASR